MRVANLGGKLPQLRAYVEAQRKYDVAKLAMAAKPGDCAANELLRSAGEALDRAREELKH